MSDATPHLALVGASGSGKSSFALQLAWDAPRLFVFDLSQDELWDGLPGGTFRSAREAMDLYVDHRTRPFQATVRLSEGESYMPILGLLQEVQENEPHLPPIVVVMEEATSYSNTHELPEPLEAAVTRGRRAGLVVVTVIQEDSQIHPTVRREAVKVVFRHTEPTALLRELVPDRTRRSEIMELRTLTPFDVPEGGTHFVTIPRHVDPVDHFRHLARHRPDQRLPDDYAPPLSGR